MRKILAVSLLLAAASAADVVTDVRLALMRHDLSAAERQVASYRSLHGNTPEAIEALSWLARGAQAEKQLDRAANYAAETIELARAALKTRALDAEPSLPLALGAAIEVQAQVLAARGGRAEAVSFLERELKAYRATSIRARIQKDLNLLTLAGKPAPPLDVRVWLGTRPQPLSALAGKPVLLFFWAHWCPDCKAEIPILARIMERFGPRGLVLIGPTQHYGYVAGGEDAPPARETQYIDQVRRTFYGALGPMPVPLGEENFKVYGASTVPTLVLIDRRGTVRLYHPGALSFDDLAARIEAVLR